ncbi:outer membrane transport energization protein TonB [Aliiroseovarius halocynthiae]|uniref:Energy transducer TonB n=1 Tax=Aliiroseovarius halocynthiae TaxID=985055 RepID=A0A545SNW8_9RHOB|nr:TonB family protein [Aliiroseovarius halocynthiae]TQV66682.1 energy transducer TonB [Aliiroseovarius halocynthiae]SMR82439.1 outer membrane transport energization protein TonB [Aliiroseovarius halocynthiae]
MRRYIFAILAMLISAGVHGLGFGLRAGPAPLEIEGGALGSVARLGNSFADMTQGTMSPVTTKPDVMPTTEPVQTATPVQTTTPVRATVPIPTEAVDPSKVAPVQTAKSPVAVAPAPVARPAEKPVVKPTPKERPKPRREQEKTQQPPKPAASAARKGGNSETRTGQEDGKASAPNVQASRKEGHSGQAGNAAASNYPGKVMRKLQRVRKRGRERGRAVVGFSIAASGAVAKVWLRRSSGNAKLDGAALKHVHRAAPFPAPPKGAQRQFSFEYIRE